MTEYQYNLPPYVIQQKLDSAPPPISAPLRMFAAPSALPAWCSPKPSICSTTPRKKSPPSSGKLAEPLLYARLGVGLPKTENHRPGKGADVTRPAKSTQYAQKGALRGRIVPL